MAWYNAGLGSSGGGGSSNHNYSTSEQIVGTWIDGSTLYEKTVQVSINSSGVYQLWVENSVRIRNYVGAFVFRSSGSTLSLSSRADSSQYKAELNGVGNDTTNGIYVDLTVGSSRVNVLDLVLTIRYTK